VRVRQCSCHEKLETLTIVDCLLANSDGITRASFHDFLKQDWLQ
jgi:hypothetical protein